MAKKEDLKTIKDRAFTDCSPEVAFYVCNGEVYTNLLALSDGLQKMNAETFNYHVNTEKNDFANWINRILGDTTLAQKLTKIKTQKKYADTVNQRVKELSAKG